MTTTPGSRNGQSLGPAPLSKLLSQKRKEIGRDEGAVKEIGQDEGAVSQHPKKQKFESQTGSPPPYARHSSTANRLMKPAPSRPTTGTVSPYGNGDKKKLDFDFRSLRGNHRGEWEFYGHPKEKIGSVPLMNACLEILDDAVEVCETYDSQVTEKQFLVEKLEGDAKDFEEKHLMSEVEIENIKNKRLAVAGGVDSLDAGIASCDRKIREYQERIAHEINKKKALQEQKTLKQKEDDGLKESLEAKKRDSTKFIAYLQEATGSLRAALAHLEVLQEKLRLQKSMFAHVPGKRVIEGFGISFRFDSLKKMQMTVENIRSISKGLKRLGFPGAQGLDLNRPNRSKQWIKICEIVGIQIPANAPDLTSPPRKRKKVPSTLDYSKL